MVYSPLQAAAKYFRYYVHSANSKGHGVHSPFVFEFITKVMNDFTPDSDRDDDYARVEGLRKELLKDTTELEVKDMGAGSAKTSSNRRTIASIAKNAAKPKKFGQLLYRMVQYYQPKTVLELGTSLGITTGYLALANPDAGIITLEGAPEIATRAKGNFQKLDITNIRVVEGNFDDTLGEVLQQNPKIDFAFIDGNHRREPAERYFSQLLPYIHNDSLLVFDDIHWSKEMEAAWNSIVQHEAVTCNIDLFFIGIVSFRKEFKEKQHFSVRI